MHVACEPVELRDDQLGLVLLAGSKRRGELWPVGSLATLDLDMLGCSANVIASITGHRSLNEVERYTRAADQARMAREGMSMLIKKRTEVANQGDWVATSENYFSEIKV